MEYIFNNDIFSSVVHSMYTGYPLFLLFVVDKHRFRSQQILSRDLPNYEITFFAFRLTDWLDSSSKLGLFL